MSGNPISKDKHLIIYDVNEDDEGEYFCVGQSKSGSHFIARTILEVDGRY